MSGRNFVSTPAFLAAIWGSDFWQALPPHLVHHIDPLRYPCQFWQQLRSLAALERSRTRAYEILAAAHRERLVSQISQLQHFSGDPGTVPQPPTAGLTIADVACAVVFVERSLHDQLTGQGIQPPPSCPLTEHASSSISPAFRASEEFTSSQDYSPNANGESWGDDEGTASSAGEESGSEGGTASGSQVSRNHASPFVPESPTGRSIFHPISVPSKSPTPEPTVYAPPISDRRNSDAAGATTDSSTVAAAPHHCGDPLHVPSPHSADWSRSPSYGPSAVSADARDPITWGDEIVDDDPASTSAPDAATLNADDASDTNTDNDTAYNDTTDTDTTAFPLTRHPRNPTPPPPSPTPSRPPRPSFCLATMCARERAARREVAAKRALCAEARARRRMWRARADEARRYGEMVEAEGRLDEMREWNEGVRRRIGEGRRGMGW